MSFCASLLRSDGGDGAMTVGGFDELRLGQRLTRAQLTELADQLPLLKDHWCVLGPSQQARALFA